MVSRLHEMTPARKADPINATRTQKSNPAFVKDYFIKLDAVITQLGLKRRPDKIFNMDEKGAFLRLHH
ncbi:hypothetical protein PR048_001180 [Dryococelus australis]|uniref:Uncharacterized protein n=1 Tax=Dryococelus australis TaxID=614101 RepID=A0ABQ9IGQ3_9NEOP|nr:hypothetical protein PR048_001180 [Dryococelus australis]